MRFEELNWFDIENYLKTDNRLLVYGDGVFGRPYAVDPAILDEIFTTNLQDILALLRFE
jgi:hypothetical protein